MFYHRTSASVNRNPVGCGIRNPANICCKIRNPGLLSPEHSSRNPESTNNWNPESKSHWKESGIQNLGLSFVIKRNFRDLSGIVRRLQQWRWWGAEESRYVTIQLLSWPGKCRWISRSWIIVDRILIYTGWTRKIHRFGVFTSSWKREFSRRARTAKKYVPKRVLHVQNCYFAF